MRFLDWLKQPPQWHKRAVRHTKPGIVACYWDGTGQMAHLAKDISLTGAYLCTTEPWHVGTMVVLTLQEDGPCESTSPLRSISIPCRIARHGPDGVGVNFMLHVNNDRKALERFMSATVHMRRSRSVLGLEVGAGGQALVEYAFMVPFLFLLIVNCVNFGAFIYTWITVANASRAGVQYAVLSGASAGALTAATGAQITTLVTSDMASLPGTPTVNVCKSNNGVVTTLAGTCSNVPADPEDPLYVMTTVDVTYTFVPPLGALSFPKLGIHATIPATTLYRRADMRSIQ